MGTLSLEITRVFVATVHANWLKLLNSLSIHAPTPIAIPELEAAARALYLNHQKNLQDDVDFRKPRS
jgi:hypothetical protein